MDTLFTTTINTNSVKETFSVSFNNEQYIFKSSTGSINFNLRREDDEWHSNDAIDEELKKAAIEKLDSYLLSQH